MQEQGHGSIVNVSSTYGHKGAAGASIYTASKHAVEGLTKSAAIEGAAFNIRVNAVAPGPVETGMLNRFTGSSERKAGPYRHCAAAAHRNTGGDCSRRAVSGLGQGQLHYRSHACR
jgi:NAD(P)-dependent dehydrogenase (short-subunit alcohol dehydrogenase family)